MRHSKSSSQRLPEEIKLSLYKPTDSKARFQSQKKWESFLLAPLILYIRNSILVPYLIFLWRDITSIFLLGHDTPQAVPAAAQLLLSANLPETPRWLLSQSRKEEAKDSLRQLFRKVGIPQPQLLRTDPPALLEKDDANKKAKKSKILEKLISLVNTCKYLK